MADRLTAEIPRLGKVTTQSAIDFAKLESQAETDGRLGDAAGELVQLAAVRDAVRWTCTVTEPSGKTAEHGFDDQACAEAFVEGFKAAGKLRRRSKPKPKGTVAT